METFSSFSTPLPHFADDSNFVTRMDEPTQVAMYLHLFHQISNAANLESQYVVGIGGVRPRPLYRGRRRRLFGRVRCRLEAIAISNWRAGEAKRVPTFGGAFVFSQKFQPYRAA
jgi:hypothetical protein